MEMAFVDAVKLLESKGICGTVSQYNGNSRKYVLRQEGKPKIDYLPHTNRWIVYVGDRNKRHEYKGSLKAFINWYEKQ